MRNNFNRKQFAAKCLSREDWSAYRDFCLSFFGEASLDNFLGGKDSTKPENWEHFIENSGYVLFGLFHQEKMVGSSAILFRDNDAVFTGIMIVPEYQRKGLADLLHDVRKQYLKELDFNGGIITEILAQNEKSIRAAERNGFRYSFSNEEGQATYMTFFLTQSPNPK